MSEKPEKVYKETIILPKTDFAMKADLARREPEQWARWESADLYGKIRAARKGAPKFVLHDGPPYATGDLHVGTGLNKVLKDIVVRYKTLRGFDAPYRPGWDCHGLPIEHKVAKELGPKIRDMTTADVRTRCLEYAMKFFGRNREDFQRLLIFGNWANPYLTVNHDYEAGVLDLFAELVAGGYVYRSLRPIHWCMTDRTALAEAELEYDDITSTSVYVAFPLTEESAQKAAKIMGTQAAADPNGPLDVTPVGLLIWTTTPWTLPANLAIAVHPDFDYALVDCVDSAGQHRRLILAAGLLDSVAKVAGLSYVTVLGTCKGKQLEGLTYRHVFLERTSPVVLADYVTLDDGTGCVHTAPGHGREDFLTGQRYGLEPLSPVDPTGRFTEAGGPFAGQQVFEADPNVVKLLTEKGALLATAPIKHSYPHCWRCHEPVIFRATEQWFVNVEHDNLRARLIEQIDRVQWIPDWGKARILGMVNTRPDWCISRQRSWGVPIPAFYCTGCGETVLTADSVRHVRDLFAQHGSDYWFTHEAADLAPAGLVCPKCNGTKFDKEDDIFDVWFESGSSHWSVLRNDPGVTWPADLYLEGSDQHRGWFQVSMITATAARGEPPFKAVLTHGFVVDERGVKMSKSQGNFISVADAIKAVGADIFRLWVASANFRDDINTSLKLMAVTGESYRKIRNTIRFILGNLFDFDPAKDAVAPADLPAMDRWVVMQAKKLHHDCCEFYDQYLFHRVFTELFAFCDTTLSSFYLDSLKDRLYCDGANSHSRRSAQTAICHCLGQIIQLLAPICPFTAEEAFAAIPHKTGQFAQAESVHLLTLEPPPGDWDDAKLAEHFDRLFKVRTDVLVQLEALRKAKTIGNGLDAKVSLFSADGDWMKFLADHAAILPPFFNVSSVVLAESAGEKMVAGVAEPKVLTLAEPSTAPKCERCWRRLDSVGADATHATLCTRCAEAVKAR